MVDLNSYSIAANNRKIVLSFHQKKLNNIILKNPQQAILQKANFWKPFYIQGILYFGTGFGPPFQGPNVWLQSRIIFCRWRAWSAQV